MVKASVCDLYEYSGGCTTTLYSYASNKYMSGMLRFYFDIDTSALRNNPVCLRCDTVDSEPFAIIVTN